MRIDVVTVFPEMIEHAVSQSIIGRARRTGSLDVKVWDLREFTSDRHRTTDDSPYGGGVGMVMKVEPLDTALRAISESGGAEPPAHVVLMCPQGRTLDHDLVETLASYGRIVLICGHYEGVDERVREHLVHREVSIGDYVLTGGELPALVVIDAIARLVPGVLGKDESAEEESFSQGLLEYPQYTRPEQYGQWRVPDVLLSGHHAQVASWRRRESLRRTLDRRPDLLRRADLAPSDLDVLEDLGAAPELLAELAEKQQWQA